MNLTAIAFFPSESAWKIRFHSGSIYRYSDFSLDDFHLFRNAHSKGFFFHQQIKDQYECVRF
jgi:KTSC domain